MWKFGFESHTVLIRYHFMLSEEVHDLNINKFLIIFEKQVRINMGR